MSNRKELHATKDQERFRQTIAKRFDQLTTALKERGPLTFRHEVQELQQIGYRVIALAAQQKEAGL